MAVNREGAENGVAPVPRGWRRMCGGGADAWPSVSACRERHAAAGRDSSAVVILTARTRMFTRTVHDYIPRHLEGELLQLASRFSDLDARSTAVRSSSMRIDSRYRLPTLRSDSSLSSLPLLKSR